MNCTAILDGHNPIVHRAITRLRRIIVDLEPNQGSTQLNVIEHAQALRMVLVATRKCLKNAIISDLSEVNIEKEAPCHVIHLPSPVEKLDAGDRRVDIFEA